MGNKEQSSRRSYRSRQRQRRQSDRPGRSAAGQYVAVLGALTRPRSLCSSLRRHSGNYFSPPMLVSLSHASSPDAQRTTLSSSLRPRKGSRRRMSGQAKSAGARTEHFRPFPCVRTRTRRKGQTLEFRRSQPLEACRFLRTIEPMNQQPKPPFPRQQQSMPGYTDKSLTRNGS